MGRRGPAGHPRERQLRPLHHVPVHIVTGFLGTGKTTALLRLLANKPTGEGPWAVLVNEFGEIGVDGALLAAQGSAVREVPGGCICCSAGPLFHTSLVRLLREVRPARVFIEPSGLARPAVVVDTVRSLGEAVSLRAVLTLVDPRHLADPRHTTDETWQEQVTVGDVLVGTHQDVLSAEDISAFERFVAAQDPPKVDSGLVSHGVLPPRWLTLEPAPRASAHHDAHEQDWLSRTWVWGPEVVFDRRRLLTLVQQLLIPGPWLPDGAERIKGLMHTPRAWLALQGKPEQLHSEGSAWRRDSRLEVVVRAAPGVDLDAIDAALGATVASGAAGQ